MFDEDVPTCPVCRLRFASDAHLKDHISLDHPDFDEATRREPGSRRPQDPTESQKSSGP